MDGALSWLTGASAEQKRALLGASLGWMLDSMDVMLYAMVLGEVQHEMHFTAIGGAMMSATLVSAAIGGLSFGWFADRFGRTRALTWSILVYSVSTAMCGLTQSALQLMICRILLGLGMGGEWASGAVLVAETWGPLNRGKALALVQSSWAVGYALGAAVWRLLCRIWMARRVLRRHYSGGHRGLVKRGLHEPQAWKQERSTRIPVSTLFKGALGRATLICATMNAATLFAWWGLFTWVPRFLSMPQAEGGRGLSIVQTSEWTIAMQAGAFMGYIAFGYIADRFSRKYTYIGFLVTASLLVPAFAFVRQPGALLAIGPFVGFFGTGYFSGFSVIASELFPTSLRGTAMGFVYNIGRVTSAAAPYLIGSLAQTAGLSSALTITSGAFLLAALIATALRLPAIQSDSEA